MRRSIPPTASALRRASHESPELLPRHELLTRVTQLEMSRTRKKTELQALQRRVDKLVRETKALDAEVTKLMKLAIEREDAPAGLEPATRRVVAASTGFKLRY